MKSHSARQRLAALYSWRGSDDLSHMFMSLPLAESARKFFGFRTEWGTFRYTRMPWGFNWSPFIAHICADEICKRALEAGFHVTHYLDDFDYFDDSPTEVETARMFVRALFADQLHCQP